MEKKDNIIKNSLTISVIVFIGKILGFVKQAVVAWAFGANASTDIYFAADGYTSMFGQIMGTSVAPTVLTRYVKLEEEGEKRKAQKLIQQSYIFFGIVGIVLVLLNMLFSSHICNLIGISYSLEQKSELRIYVIALCPVMLLTSLSGVSQGYLDAHRRFLPAKLCSLFFSISIIVSVLLFHNQLGLKSFLIGFLFGYVAHTLLMVSLTITKTGIWGGNPFKNIEFRKMIRRFGPLVIGNSVVDLGHLIDKIVASSLMAGSVSVLYYGQVISGDLVNAVIISSVGTVLLTSFTRSVAGKTEKNKIADKIEFIICSMTLLTALISSLYFVEGTDLIELFFERGNFGHDSTVIVSSLASFYAMGFIFMANREVLIKAHYAFQDTFTPMINSVIGVIVNLIGSIILSKIMGITGIALATSFSMLIVAIISLFTLKKHLGRFPVSIKCVLDWLKILLSGSISCVGGFFLNNLLIGLNIMIRLVLVSCSMVSIYFLFAVLLKEEVVRTFVLPIIKTRILRKE